MDRKVRATAAKEKARAAVNKTVVCLVPKYNDCTVDQNSNIPASWSILYFEKGNRVWTLQNLKNPAISFFI